MLNGTFLNLLLVSCLESYGIIFSVITLQETWLDIDPKIFELENFVSFDQPRTCSQHGGLKTFVRNNFTAKKLEIFDRCETFDGLFVEIKDPTSNKKIVIANIYKPPKTYKLLSMKFLPFLTNLTQTTMLFFVEILILIY